MATDAEQNGSGGSERDPLTGLPSRHGLLSRAEPTIEGRAAAAVYLVDIDGFRRLNREQGHAAADLLLFAVGRRLLSAAPPGSIVSRLGGDEFAVLDASPGAAGSVPDLAAELAAAFDDPFDLDSMELQVSVSVGVATSTVAPHRVEALLADAEAALERSPEPERRIEVFDRALGESIRERLAIGRDLARALDRDALHFHYQPIVDLASGRVVSVEVLARWRDPGRGDVSPELFVPIAEESGRGAQLLDRAIEHVVADLPLLADVEGAGSISVAINVSADRLASKSLPESVARLLEATAIEPRRVVIEISETALAGGAEAYLRSIDALRTLGVRVSLDDFGTASTSIAQLRALPIDQIKLDRSFVAGLGQASADSALTAGILPIARALGVEVVAEGIETQRQLAHLFALGYRLGQGYLLARPMSATDGAALLSFGPLAATRRVETDALVGSRDSFRQALLDGDARAAEGIVAAALSAGIDPIDVQAEVIGRALHWVETEGQAGRLRAADRHLAAAICERQLTAVLDRRNHPTRRFAPPEHKTVSITRAARS